MMIRQNKWKLIISSIIILIPWLAGSGTGSFIGNISPWFLLIVHWICVFFTAADPKNKNQNNKVFGLVLWISPVLSAFIYLMDRAIASGREFTAEMLSTVGIGLMFTVIGNYLPKCKQNYTIGIKLPWTIRDEENWNMTHRLGGKLWMAGGIIVILASLMPSKVTDAIVPAVMLFIVIVPVVYSYLLYRKQKSAGTYGTRESDRITAEELSRNKKITKVGIAVVCLIFAGVAVLMFSGRISYICEETSLRIEASYWNDSVIDYNDIEALEYRDKDDPGSRVGGFGSARLLMGNFRNDEFGYYTRYSYTGKGACIVMTVDERTVVLGCENPQKTEELYEELVERVQ